MQDLGLVILRIIIGWHLLYEGIVKVMEPGWTSETFLANSRGVFSGLFIKMASQPVILEIVDFFR